MFKYWCFEMVGCVYENCSHLKRERLRSPMLLQCSGFPKAAAMYVTLWQLSFPSASKVRKKKKKKESVRKDRRGTAIRDWRRLEVWHRLHFCWIRDRAATSRLYVIALSFIVNCPTDGQLANLRFTKRCPILNVCKFRGGGLTNFFATIYKINFGPLTNVDIIAWTYYLQ